MENFWKYVKYLEIRKKISLYICKAFWKFGKNPQHGCMRWAPTTYFDFGLNDIKT